MNDILEEVVSDWIKSNPEYSVKTALDPGRDCYNITLTDKAFQTRTYGSTVYDISVKASIPRPENSVKACIKNVVFLTLNTLMAQLNLYKFYGVKM